LNAVLKKHVESLGVKLLDDSDVSRENGQKGIVDLMLSRLIPQADAMRREHLVVELKRPSVSIGQKEAAQVKSYAFAIADDDRFRDTTTTWTFWALSRSIDSSVRKEATQANRPSGVLYEEPDGRIQIWVKSWGEIIEQCRTRLQFFADQLKYEVTSDSAMRVLRRTHEKYLPKILQDDDTSSHLS
jgi:hypothetical protein